MISNKYDKVALKITGNNLTNFINICVANNIVIDNINKDDSNSININVNNYDYKVIKNLVKNQYKIEIVSDNFVKRLLRTVKFRMGLIIGIVVSLVMFFMLNNRLLSVHIFGNEKVDKQSIETALESYGIKKYNLMNFDSSVIENFLISEFDFSFVSIVTKGNALIINVKEEISDNKNSYSPITAEYNMVITKINVFSGTPRVSAGDVLLKGDIIVEPYEIRNDEMIEVDPCAEIYADIFFSESYKHYSTESVLVRTGNSCIVDSSVMIGNIKLFAHSVNNNFENFELEEKSLLVTDYFLPIVIKKTYAYETSLVDIEHNFEEEKAEIIDNLKNSVYSKVPKTMSIDDEQIIISSTNFGNIATINLKSSVYLRYNFN